MNNAPSFSYSGAQGQRPDKGQYSVQNQSTAQYTHPVHYPNPAQYANASPYAIPQIPHSSPQPPHTQVPPIGPGPPVGVSRTFQSLEDFIREQDQLDAVRSAEMRAKAATALAYSHPNSKKFKKAPPAIDAEVVAAEARAVAEIAATNWTGRLGEYRAAHPTAISIKGLEYNEVGTSRFRCTATIHEAPHIQFGQDNNLSFAKKKDAKQFASKKAIDWLIASGFMPPDGAVRWPKPTPLPPSKVIGPKIPSAAQSTVAKGKNTFTAQIPPLAHRLGFSPPTYDISRVSEEAPFYNGHAHWPNDPRISGKIGEVTNVYGQKNTKEMVAQEVFAFLTDIERQRTAKDEGPQKAAIVDATRAEEGKLEQPRAVAARLEEVKVDDSTSVHDSGAEAIKANKTTTDDEDRKRKRSLTQDDDEEKSGKSLKLGMPIREP